jgi:hypothetical protein
MNSPDLLILVVGVFVTFMAVWASVAYGVLIVQRWELASAQSGPATESGGEGAVEASPALGTATSATTPGSSEN